MHGPWSVWRVRSQISSIIHSKDKAEEVIKSIESVGAGKAVTVQADVSGMEGAKALLQETVRLAGHIDILVLNVGIMGSARLSNLTEDFYDQHFNTNVESPLFLTQAAVPHMPPGGQIIFFSTGLAIQAGLTSNYVPGLYRDKGRHQTTLTDPLQGAWRKGHHRQ